ncbi:MAG: D-glycerate dehydrogenase [Candidatus Niyogibacteria bacterium CG10_big_fil_rev_8_21_14_0_10_46_36]|uniref:D-glycerate dehydrogenase n=1 Tax=Candidatus Niyogibacteria bacterium CG10_big_fil_rev_8_21_14_0_10_46_36 TaxID=1974726 RepID=A0A2H0TEX0_9BACT|nr:MAG: D-glycerate dehydrogenase [Candidatus Niyogibacteria bacterium CG10_big_fil_rev_8_21_14_0_10_46_36]
MKIFVTRQIPDEGINALQGKGYELTVSPHDRVLTKEELIGYIQGKEYDAVLCLLTDTIDAQVLDAAGPQCKIFANYAVGFDNIDLKAAAERNITITNTPGVLTNTVAEHTFALMLAISHRVAEADRFTRNGMYKGWAPMLLLGNDLSSKTIGIIGLGRIGSRVAHHAVHGFDAKIIYHDIKRNEEFEKEFGAVYKETLEDLLGEADYVSIHVPLLDATRHLMNAERFGQMKSTAYVINTSRGPVIDEQALLEALQKKTIKGAAIDVFEGEPAVTPGLADLENIIMTPHIASGTEETRQAMSRLAADNIIAVFEGREAPNKVVAK